MKFREEKEDHIMSSMKKRILALVLALVMCVGMLPTGVFATETDLGEESGVVADISTEAPNQTDTALEETGTETESDNETEPEAIDINSGTVPSGTVIDPAQPEQTGEPEAAPAATAPAEAETQEPGESPAPAESTEGSYTVEDFMAAMDKCDDIYASLSKEDQAAMAEHYAALQAYRADPNDGVETLDYTSYTSHITLGAGDGSPTGMKMSVGDHWYGHWYVESISLSSVKFGSKYGEHNNSNFKVPAPEDIWEGVSSNYKTVAGYRQFSPDNLHRRECQIYQCDQFADTDSYNGADSHADGARWGLCIGCPQLLHQRKFHWLMVGECVCVCAHL